MMNAITNHFNKTRDAKGLHLSVFIEELTAEEKTMFSTLAHKAKMPFRAYVETILQMESSK